MLYYNIRYYTILYDTILYYTVLDYHILQTPKGPAAGKGTGPRFGSGGWKTWQVYNILQGIECYVY